MQNFDLREVIPRSESNHDFPLFFASDTSVESSAREISLALLRETFIPEAGSRRQEISDSSYLFAIRTHLGKLAKERSTRVKLWLKTNTVRFSRDQPDIQKLWKTFDELAKDLLAGVEVCGKTCGQGGCQLVCLRPKLHDGGDESHNCSTNHRCVGDCVFEHDSGVACGYPYVSFFYFSPSSHANTYSLPRVGLAIREGICEFDVKDRLQS